MKISSAEFVTSATGVAGLPKDGLAEIALVGRSNVGKSSLINALVRRTIARTSQAPGKTRLVNIYRIGLTGRRPFYLVDLPGYGYARGTPGAGSDRAFEPLVHGYFFGGGSSFRPTIAGVVFLVDARHLGLPHDVAAGRWLAQHGTRLAVAATKVDKISKAMRRATCEALDNLYEARCVPVSTYSGEGLDDLWKQIAEWLNPR